MLCGRTGRRTPKAGLAWQSQRAVSARHRESSWVPGGGLHRKDLVSQVMHLGFNHSVLTLALCPPEKSLNSLSLTLTISQRRELQEMILKGFSNETSKNHSLTKASCGIVRSSF